MNIAAGLLSPWCMPPNRIYYEVHAVSRNCWESDPPLTDRQPGCCSCTDHHAQHAMRTHIRKLMKLIDGQDLPEGVFEGTVIPPSEPVRFVWSMTTKQSSTNATMKKRILHDLKANRHKYKHVPDKDFSKKALEAAFEQVFTTLRQKFKAQHDNTAATRLKRREDNKALKARRLQRKKGVSPPVILSPDHPSPHLARLPSLTRPLSLSCRSSGTAKTRGRSSTRSRSPSSTAPFSLSACPPKSRTGSRPWPTGRPCRCSARAAWPGAARACVGSTRSSTSRTASTRA